MTAWENLIEHSDASAGSTAWEHLNSITVGGGTVTIVGSLSSTLNSLLSSSVDSVLSSTVDESVLSSDIITITDMGEEDLSATITTGDDSTIIHTLRKNDATFNIPSTATVTCRLVTVDHEPLSSEVVQSHSSVGADWSNSVVAIVLPATNTNEVVDRVASWRCGSIVAKLETQVNDGGKLTWFDSVTITKGTIT